MWGVTKAKSFLVGHRHGQVNVGKKTINSAKQHVDLHTLNYSIHTLHSHIGVRPNNKVKHGSSEIKFDYSVRGICTHG